MKIKIFVIAAMSALLFGAPALPARTADGLSLERALAMQAADKELDQFLRAKEAVFERDWPQARKQLEKFLKDFPAGRLRMRPCIGWPKA